MYTLLYGLGKIFTGREIYRIAKTCRFLSFVDVSICRLFCGLVQSSKSAQIFSGGTQQLKQKTTLKL